MNPEHRVMRHLTRAAVQLNDAGVDDAARDARKIMSYVLGTTGAHLTLHLHDRLTQDQWLAYQMLIQRRAEGTPVSHLVGGRDFYKNWFAISDAVLDPRPDTELLVDLALGGPISRVLDLGTGSGCVLLSLLSERDDATGIGTDISTAALAMAANNADTIGVTGRCNLVQSNWFDAVDGQFDLIVSNPPYIAAAEMHELAREVRDWEPRLALTDEGDGLAAYRAIIPAAPKFLTEDGCLMVEIGPTQAEYVANLYTRAGFSGVRVHKDLNDKDRVVSGTIG